MQIKAFFKYYWGLLRFAFSKSLSLALLASAILNLIAHYIGDKHPDWSSKMNAPLWEIPFWIFVSLAIIRLILAPFEKHKNQQKKIDELEQKELSPLQIIFDRSNPSKRFWSMESPEDEKGVPHPCWEYRVEVSE